MGVTIVDFLGHAPWLVTDAARASEFSLDAPADAAPSELCSVVLPQLCSTLHFVVAAEPGLIGTGNAAPRVAVCACAVRDAVAVAVAVAVALAEAAASWCGQSLSDCEHCADGGVGCDRRYGSCVPVRHRSLGGVRYPRRRHRAAVEVLPVDRE